MYVIVLIKAKSPRLKVNLPRCYLYTCEKNIKGLKTSAIKLILIVAKLIAI